MKCNCVFQIFSAIVRLQDGTKTPGHWPLFYKSKKVPDVSCGSVETHLRYAVTFSYAFTINLLLLSAKEFRKLSIVENGHYLVKLQSTEAKV